MNTLILKKGRKKPSSSQSQLLFNRQRRKIQTLLGQIEQIKQECEEALLLYHSALRPKEQKAADCVTHFILRILELTQNRKALTKKEKEIFEELLEDVVNLVFSLVPPDEVHETVRDLYEKIHGKSIDDQFYEELSSFKEMLEKESGLGEIDMSHINPKDSLQDVLLKLSQSLHTAFGENPEAMPPPKQKSKKMLFKEEAERNLQELQKKGIGSIYKRLAKVLHPDLEQDLEKQKEKIELMKRLTKAYEESDLVSLLLLESEWLGDAKTMTEETLVLYNSLLKEQIKDLEREIRSVHLHPRYIDIYPRIETSPNNPLLVINKFLSDCDGIIEAYSHRLEELAGEHPLKALKKGLASVGMQQLPVDVFTRFQELLR